ncbi:MAG: hypothetical protein AABY47_02500 [Pseudomonadota bacterium]
MSDEQKKIIISRISGYRQNESGEFERVPISPVNRWIALAILIPVIALMAVLGVFFFAAFMALLAVAAVVIGVRFWWLRRKFENETQQPGGSSRQTETDRAIIIEDAQIIEETEIHRTKKEK